MLLCILLVLKEGEKWKKLSSWKIFWKIKKKKVPPTEKLHYEEGTKNNWEKAKERRSRLLCIPIYTERWLGLFGVLHFFFSATREKMHLRAQNDLGIFFNLHLLVMCNITQYRQQYNRLCRGKTKSRKLMFKQVHFLHVTWLLKCLVILIILTSEQHDNSVWH